jgi:hypothetical protein
VTVPYIGDDGCPQIGVGGCHCNHFIDGELPCCWCGQVPNGPMEGAAPDEDEWLVFDNGDEEKEP